MADRKITQLNALTVANSDAGDLVPVVDVSATETKSMRLDEILNPKDSIFRVSGSLDSTKKVAFEVDGLTTATTRTLTVTDGDGIIATDSNTLQINNKTIGTGTKVAVGSDATGDSYYRDSSGNFTRRAIGSTNQIYTVDATGVPVWADNTATTNGSTTVKGVFEEATSSEIDSAIATGGTGARLVVTAEQLALSRYGGTKTAVLNKTYTDAQVINTTTETNLVSYSVAGGTLSTNNVIRVTGVFNYSFTGSGAGNNLTIRLKYGATTVASATITPTAAAGSSSENGAFTFYLMATGATGTQEGSFVMFNIQALLAGAISTNNVFYAHANGTSAEDSTASKTLAITGQFASANVANFVTFRHFVIEQL